MKLGKHIFILVISIIVTGCSVKKNTWISRNYHTLNSYYNVYYNGAQAFKEGEKAIYNGVNNDYTSLLPVFPESNKDVASAATGDMDRAIEKGKKLIEKHSITAKPKRRQGKMSDKYKAFMKKREFNPLVDDAWLLIGKSNVVKHDNADAISVLDYVIREYDGSNSRYEAMIWLSRAYANMEQYVNAQAALEGYDIDGMAPTNLYADFMAANASVLLAQGKYADALPYMKGAAQNTTKRMYRFRYNYILAQLYKLTGDDASAYTAFGNVIKGNPDYDMSFSARINMSGVTSGKSGMAETEKSLNKLRRDKKNKEYLDQIYYAMGLMKLNNGEENAAIENFKKSVASSTSNDNQKGLSFVTLGDVYYKKPLYIEAFQAYDSALVFVNEANTRYAELNERHSHLTDLSSHLITIRDADSLLHLANMPSSERDKIIDDILAKQKEELDKQQKAEQSYFGDTFFQNDLYQQSQQGGQAGGKWYFYNVATVGAGKQEFERSWGKRKNEDNWRRSVKTSTSVDSDEYTYREPGMDIDGGTVQDGAPDKGAAGAEKAETPAPAARPAIATRESLMADIPLTEDAQKKKHKAIEESLFESGMLLYAQVGDYKSAAAYYERLLADYSTTSNREAALTGLYQSYEKLGDEVNMARVKRIITGDYPLSLFAQYLSDPEFFEKQKQLREDNEKHYEATYSNYLMGRYTEVLADTENALKTTTPYKAKYMLLKALSHARMAEALMFKLTLDEVVKLYPNTEESKLASAMLAEIDKGRQPIKAELGKPISGTATAAQSHDGAAAEAEEVKFVYSPYEEHYAVILCNEAVNINQLQYNIADFNFGRFLIADYSLKSRLMADGVRLMLVKGLKNKVEALDYLYVIREQKAIFDLANLTNPEIVVVSVNNINLLLNNNDMVRYATFFNDHYLTAINEPEKEVKPEVTPKAEVVEVVKKPVVENVKPAVEKAVEKVAESEVVENIVEEVVEKTAEKVEEIKPAPAPVVASEPSIFEDDDLSGYCVTILIKKARNDLRRLQTILTNFTINYYGDDIKGEASDMGVSHRVIKVTGFKNKEEAQNYLHRVETESALVRNMVGNENHLFVMTETNYNLLMENKNIEAYIKFIER